MGTAQMRQFRQPLPRGPKRRSGKVESPGAGRGNDTSQAEPGGDPCAVQVRFSTGKNAYPPGLCQLFTLFRRWGRRRFSWLGLQIR